MLGTHGFCQDGTAWPWMQNALLTSSANCSPCSPPPNLSILGTKGSLLLLDAPCFRSAQAEWGQRGSQGGTLCIPSPPRPPCSPSPLVPFSPSGPLNSLPLTPGKPRKSAFPRPCARVRAASTPPYPLSLGCGHFGLTLPRAGPPRGGGGPPLGPPSACFRKWHHHPTPQAAQSSGQQLATSSRPHEATERHGPSPVAGCGARSGGVPPTLCSQSQILACTPATSPSHRPPPNTNTNYRDLVK